MEVSTVSQNVWIDKQLSVSRVDQRKKWYCGPACAEMLLNYFSIKIDQTVAYQEIHDGDRFKEERLYSDPKGMVDYINTVNDQSVMVDVIDMAEVDQKVVLDRIYSKIIAENFPITMLSLGGDHWVVVSGVRYLDSLDGPRQYAGFYIQNPWKGSTPMAWVEVSEFMDRWVRPNKFGSRWLNKIVILANDKIQGGAANGILDRDSYRLKSSSGSRTADAVAAMQMFGFEMVREVSGGGALVLKSVEVVNEDTGGTFWITPLDATDNKEFADFVYVSSDGADGHILEISGMSEQVDIPSIDDAKKIISAYAPDVDYQIDERVFWRSRVGAVSRTDVYRKIELGGRMLFLLRSGEIVPSLDVRPLSGG